MAYLFNPGSDKIGLTIQKGTEPDIDHMVVVKPNKDGYKNGKATSGDF